MKSHPYKKKEGGGRNIFSHAKGGGAQNVLGVGFCTVA